MSVVPEPVVELQDLGVDYPGGIRAVDRVNLEVAPRDLLGLIGPNGAGKSTLIRVVVRLFGRPVEPSSLRDVGFVPQHPQPTYRDFPATVFETILLGEASHAGLFERSTHGDRERAEEILKLLDIDRLRDRRIGHLSGGETQRVFLAKALVGHPRLLILDEPTSGIDAQSRREFYAILVRLNRDLGITIVLTSHDIHSVTRLASRIAFMSRTIFFDGSPGEFALHPIHSDLEDFPEAAMARP